MSTRNFHQSVTEINRLGYCLHSLQQVPMGNGTFRWACEIVNEAGDCYTSEEDMPLTAMTVVIDLATKNTADDCADLV